MEKKALRILFPGYFDLFHYGHVRALRTAKEELFPDYQVHVVVGGGIL
jgi:cytidyltransferase-like protein